jgi:hypothetical protein
MYGYPYETKRLAANKKDKTGFRWACILRKANKLKLLAEPEPRPTGVPFSVTRLGAISPFGRCFLALGAIFF